MDGMSVTLLCRLFPAVLPPTWALCRGNTIEGKRTKISSDPTTRPSSHQGKGCKPTFQIGAKARGTPLCWRWHPFPSSNNNNNTVNHPPVGVGDEHLHVRVALKDAHGILGRHLAQRAHGAELERGLDRSQEHLNNNKLNKQQRQQARRWLSVATVYVSQKVEDFKQPSPERAIRQSYHLIY